MSAGVLSVTTPRLVSLVHGRSSGPASSSLPPFHTAVGGRCRWGDVSGRCHWGDLVDDGQEGLSKGNYSGKTSQSTVFRKEGAEIIFFFSFVVTRSLYTLPKLFFFYRTGPRKERHDKYRRFLTFSRFTGCLYVHLPQLSIFPHGPPSTLVLSYALSEDR